MLLPVADTPGSERRVSSFVAALELGLRLHFSGRVDHLRATTRRGPRSAGAAGSPVSSAAAGPGSAAASGPEEGAAPENGGGAPRHTCCCTT